MKTPLLPLTRFRQCRGKEPRWNCDDCQPNNQHKEGEYFATDSHRSDITVAHGRQSDDGSPEGMEDRSERLGLRLILEVIHPHRGQVELGRLKPDGHVKEARYDSIAESS